MQSTNNHSLRKIPPSSFPTKNKVCRNFIIKDCSYRRCRNGRHDEELKLQYNSDATPLIDTKEGTPHYLDFYCRICHKLIVPKEDISRIHRNAIWCFSIENSWVSPNADFHPIKSDKLGKEIFISPVFCLCGNWIGDKFRGYINEEEYKLEYVGRNGKNSALYFEGSEEKHTPLEDRTAHPLEWKNKKNIVESKYSEELQLSKEEVPSPFTTVMTKFIEMSITNKKLESKLKENQKENQELKENSAECPICFLGKPDIALGCGHVMHKECVKELRIRGDYKCPMCRKQAKKEEDREVFL